MPKSIGSEPLASTLGTRHHGFRVKTYLLQLRYPAKSHHFLAGKLTEWLTKEVA